MKPEAASAILDFFAPATLFIQRWLPLFYVPSLVVLPVAIKGIPTASAVKIGAILCMNSVSFPAYFTVLSLFELKKELF